MWSGASHGKARNKRHTRLGQTPDSHDLQPVKRLVLKDEEEDTLVYGPLDDRRKLKIAVPPRIDGIKLDPRPEFEPPRRVQGGRYQSPDGAEGYLADAALLASIT